MFPLAHVKADWQKTTAADMPLRTSATASGHDDERSLGQWAARRVDLVDEALKDRAVGPVAREVEGGGKTCAV